MEYDTWYQTIDFVDVGKMMAQEGFFSNDAVNIKERAFEGCDLLEIK